MPIFKLIAVCAAFPLAEVNTIFISGISIK
jgi:hypothetical protein